MYINNENVEEIVQKLKSIVSNPSETLMILFAEKSKIEINSLITKLNEENINFFGGIFPEVIYQNQAYDTGLVSLPLDTFMKPKVFKNISLGENKEIENCILEKAEYRRTSILFVDGLTKNISKLLEKINNHFGDKLNFIGGGAGSLTLKQAPCLFSNEGFFEDAAICCVVNDEVSLGISHGWSSLYGPIVATETEGNILKKINWRKAIEVYSEIVTIDNNSTITQDNFFSISKNYPFGMYKENQEFIVRDPIAFNDEGEIICVGEIPQHTILNVLKGNKDSLISAAQKVSDLIHKKNNESFSLIIDCISRRLFLNDDFSAELDVINKNLNPKENIIGALTLGEIASSGDGLLEFFNKTIVIGSFFNNNEK